MSANDKKWVKISSQELLKTSFFRLRCEEARLPNGKVCPRYYILDFVDWVNIVALTTKGELILIKQFRYPIDQTCIEIPGGAMDPRTNETPETAARRELVEETGYVPSEMKLILAQYPNPAIQSNKLWTFLALGCEKTQDQNLDPYEDIDVFTATIDETLNMIKVGEFTHSLCIASIYVALAHVK
ncbi:MAG: NUDIX hydrolase [Oligoflexia bacterium]|nr:NUDIX hydrolase [Oligoflexia bacterium]